MTADLTHMLKFETDAGVLRLRMEPTHTFGSADHNCTYPSEIRLGEPAWNKVGVWVGDNAMALIGASGGATVLHEHSALVLEERLYLAAGDQVACLSLAPFGLDWSVRADHATCFGLHFEPKRGALIVRGEMEISRLDRQGQILWQTGGRDIFTGDLHLRSDFLEVEDFNSERYRFDYDTGKALD